METVGVAAMVVMDGGGVVTGSLTARREVCRLWGTGVGAKARLEEGKLRKTDAAIIIIGTGRSSGWAVGIPGPPRWLPVPPKRVSRWMEDVPIATPFSTTP
jgi:hypothetical protein